MSLTLRVTRSYINPTAMANSHVGSKPKKFNPKVFRLLKKLSPRIFVARAHGQGLLLLPSYMEI